MDVLERTYVYLRDFRYGGYSLYRMSADPNNDDSCEQYVGNNKWNKISFLEAAEMELLSEISYEDALIIREKIDKGE